jgi:hypothetical protein
MSDQPATGEKPENQTPDEELYDVLIPPGVPRSIILDIAKKFDVDVVERMQKLSFANMDGDERELLAFRAKRDVAEQVEKYMVDEVRKFIGK